MKMARRGRRVPDGASRIIAVMPNRSIEAPFLILGILSHLETRLRSQGPENRRPVEEIDPTPDDSWSGLIRAQPVRQRVYGQIGKNHGTWSCHILSFAISYIKNGTDLVGKLLFMSVLDDS